ncbi:MAG: SMC family ATPase [Anaerolineales bacterium]
MIPIQLQLSGFLSYQQPQTLDFNTFDLACISGANGAGKSSLLDAITYALFGQARKRDESIINAQSEAAEVTFTFAYEGNIYRVQRANPRGRASLLEFQIQTPEGTWKPLSERSARATQQHIESTLRLDYDTFTNAAFILQGKADLFTQQTPANRKRILSSILGLEIWETYRQIAADQRKNIENQINALDGRLEEIQTELREEPQRKQRLKQLQDDLTHLSAARSAQELALQTIRQMTESLREQARQVDFLAQQVRATQKKTTDLETRLSQRLQERAAHEGILQRAPQIESAYREWQHTRAQLETFEQTAANFREQQTRLQPPYNAILAERARLEQQQHTLWQRMAEAEQAQTALITLQNRITEAEQARQQAETRLSQRAALESLLQTATEEKAHRAAENTRLKIEMNALKARIEQLKTAEGAACPLCGQPLNPAERATLIADLEQQGAQMGDTFRSNQGIFKNLEDEAKQHQQTLQALKRVEDELRYHSENLAALNARLEQTQTLLQNWQTHEAPLLQTITQQLESETYAPQARAELAALEAELNALGYDAAAHEAARRREVNLRTAETEIRQIEKAQAALEPLNREIADLENQHAALQAELAAQQAEHQQATLHLNDLQAQTPNLHEAEVNLLAAQEQENRLRMELGAAQQKVSVLETLKGRRARLEAERAALAVQVGQYKQLERAFGKDGVPALLIEQALPQIEQHANDLLERLSGGTMRVQFVTQAAYKDKRRADLRETLDIQISDANGVRDYEMYSGGEAFRVNFAIRLALSRVLAQRAGARLQTLVIDEGFGSQDAQGRQRLVEAINLVRADFAKILVITHLDELKDAFPNRIEVEKTAAGSTVRVL